MSLSEKSIYILLILLIAAFFLHSMLVLSFPFDARGGVEGQILDQSLRMVRGEVYRPINCPPFQHDTFPPVFPLICGLASFVFGRTLFAGRIVSLSALFLSAIFLFLVLKHFTKNKRISFIFSSAFLVSIPAFHWGVLCRVDTLALFLSLAGLFAFLREKLPFSIILFTLSFFTKFTFAIAAPLVCILWLGYSKGRIYALKYLLTIIISIGTTFLFLSFVTKGQFVLHTFWYTLLPFDLKDMLDDVTIFILTNLIFFIFMIIYQNQFKRISLPSLYLLFTIAILIVSIGKKGTDINYFLEATAGILLYAGISFNALLHKFNKNLLSFLFLLLLAQLLFINPVFKIRKHMQLERLAMPGISQAQRVYNYIKSSLGPVLVEDDEYAVFAGKTVFLNDSFNFSFLSRQGKWDMSDFLAMCERKEFTVIAFYWRYYSLPGLMQCIKRNYILIDEFDQERTLGTAWNPRLKVGLTSAYYHWKVFVPRN